MRRFPSLRYVMTSNVPFEKNKMASTSAASVITTWYMFTKCKEAERRVKFKENRKRYREETEKCNQFPLGKYQRESCSANFIQQQAS